MDSDWTNFGTQVDLKKNPKKKRKRPSQFSLLNRKLQSMVEYECEELNQYYLAAELMDDVEANTSKMQTILERNPTKFHRSKSYLPQDNYLTDLTEELNHAIFACIKHHQMLIEFSAMMEDFFSLFVLLKSFQSTFQLCNLLFTFIKVSKSTACVCEIYPNINLTRCEYLSRLKERPNNIST